MDEDAKAQVAEKAMPSQTTTTATTNYLSSKAAIVDFAEILKATATGEAADVREAWSEHLAKKGITGEDVLLPTALITQINDTVEANGTILKLIDQTGLTVYHSALNTNGIDEETGRAKGHKGKGASKSEQTISLEDRVLRAQYIYKYLTVPKEMLRENQDTGALVKYIMTELPKRVVAEVERAIVIGDGRSSNSNNKIKSVISIREDAEDSDSVYAVEYEPEAGDGFYAAITKAATQLEADGKIYAVMSRANKASLKLDKDDAGHYIFGVGAKNVAEGIEVEDILTPSWMKNDTDHIAYLAVLSEFKGVGDKSSEAYTNFALKENKQEYLQEIYFGGGLVGYKSAVAVKPLTAATTTASDTDKTDGKDGD